MNQQARNALVLQAERERWSQERLQQELADLSSSLAAGGRSLDEGLVLAPYRFIRLEDRVAYPEPAVAAAVAEGRAHDVPLAGAWCGSIEVDWVAETPLLIGENAEAPQNEAQHVVPMRGGGDGWWIPGASLRGLIRRTCEIAGYARMSQINRHQAFGLRDFEHPYYNGKGEQAARISRLGEIKAGWLRRTDERWTIEPSELAFVAIDDLLGAEAPLSGYRGSGKDWIRLPVGEKYAETGVSPPGSRRGEFTLHFDQRNAFGFSVSSRRDTYGQTYLEATPGGSDLGHPVFAGRSPGGAEGFEKKKEYVFLTSPGDRPQVELGDTAWSRFELIHTRAGRGDRREPEGAWKDFWPTAEAGLPVPVFYIGEINAPDFAFGLTRLFKIPHRYRVGDVAGRQAEHRLDRFGPTPDGKTGQVFEPDLVEALFGHVHEPEDLGREATTVDRNDQLKGRVAFSGARVSPGAARETERFTETVMGPPRASYSPYYLTGAVKDWSSEQSRLAGRKTYLPRMPQWSPEQGSLAAITARLNRQIAALGDTQAGNNRRTRTALKFLVPATGATFSFTGRIDVHNVTTVELGLLLCAITFGDGFCGASQRHMLGRARAFGAGQIRAGAIRLRLDSNDDAKVPDADTLIAAFADFMQRQETMRGPAAAVASYWSWPQIKDWLDLSHPERGASLGGAARDDARLPPTPANAGKIRNVAETIGQDNYLRLNYETTVERMERNRTTGQREPKRDRNGNIVYETINPHQELRKAVNMRMDGDGRAIPAAVPGRALLTVPEPRKRPR